MNDDDDDDCTCAVESTLRMLTAFVTSAWTARKLTDRTTPPVRRTSCMGTRRRLLKELRDFVEDESSVGTIYIKHAQEGWTSATELPLDRQGPGPDPEFNLYEWQVVLPAPTDSPYVGCDLSVSIEFPTTTTTHYPFKPPRVRYKDPIPFHCAISSHGSIDISILKDQWSPALTAQKR